MQRTALALCVPIAFTNPNVNAIGFAEGPFDDADPAGQKWFTVGEGICIQFQAQMFNFVNHANSDLLDIGWGDTNFGQVGDTHEPRQAQFALRISR